MTGWLVGAGEFAVTAINAMGALVIAVGTVEAFARSVQFVVRPRATDESFHAAYLRYARWLIAGLTFQLGADIIATAVLPSWEDIGRLAATAAIRTFLNVFLEHDVTESERRSRQEATHPPTSP